MSCSGCFSSLGCFYNRGIICDRKNGCGATFCSKCCSFAVSLENAPNEVIGPLCMGCFQKHSSLDMSTSVEILGPEKGDAPSIVFVHGGGGCRKMFIWHARQLASKYRCILIDLPGHGSRVKDRLTLQTAIDTIVNETRLHAGSFNGMKPHFCGGSLGGYVGMELIGKHPDLFSSAIILMAGQNTGVGRGIAASLGLQMFRLILSNMSGVKLLKLMQKQANASGNIDKDLFQELALRCGMFFQQGLEQVEILSNINPRKSLPEYSGSILFLNGSKDHRDSENVWVDTSKHSKLVVYEGGDHFFSHDTRFMHQVVDEIKYFIN